MRDYHAPIQSEWAAILDHLRQKHGRSAEAFAFAYRFFSDFLAGDVGGDANQLASDIHEAWQAEFQREPQPHLAIYVLTLLENAVHKVMKDDESPDGHPAIQYLFSNICEGLLDQRYENRSFDETLRLLTESEQLPIEWMAGVNQSDKGFSVTFIYGDYPKTTEPTYGFEAPTLFLLIEKLLKPLKKAKDYQIVPFPWQNSTLLICLSSHESASVLPFLGVIMHFLQNTEKQQIGWVRDWKDAVMLFNEWIMGSQNLTEAIQNIVYGFARYLPFQRAALFAYSTQDRSGIGLFGYHFSDAAIRKIKEKLDHFPSLYKGINKLKLIGEDLHYFQPLYISDASRDFPLRYVKQFQLESLVVAPIYVPTEGKLIGAVILDKGAGVRFEVDNATYTALMKFGQSAGGLLSKFLNPEQPETFVQLEKVVLSARERDVLQLLADGASTMQAAEKLHLSEYTVRDYVSDIMKRLGAKNRTEAAVKAIRLGIIH